MSRHKKIANGGPTKFQQRKKQPVGSDNTIRRLTRAFTSSTACSTPELADAAAAALLSANDASSSSNTIRPMRSANNCPNYNVQELDRYFDQNLEEAEQEIVTHGAAHRQQSPDADEGAQPISQRRKRVAISGKTRLRVKKQAKASRANRTLSPTMSVEIASSNGEPPSLESKDEADDGDKKPAAAVKKPPLPRWHERSVWQEPPRHDGLTAYEWVREPRRLRTHHAIAHVARKFLEAEFRCAICLSFLQQTRVVVECQHRFCEACIETALRKNKHECPVCRVLVPSRRNLMPDPAFDALMQSIIPAWMLRGDAGDNTSKACAAAAHAREEQTTARGKKGRRRPQDTMRHEQSDVAAEETIPDEGQPATSNNADMMENRTPSHERDVSVSEHEAVVPPTDATPDFSAVVAVGDKTTTTVANTPRQSAAPIRPPQKVDLLIRPHPSTRLPELTMPFWRCDDNTTVESLAKFACTKLGVPVQLHGWHMVDSSNEITRSTNQQPRLQAVPLDWTLWQCKQQHVQAQIAEQEFGFWYK